MIDLSKIPCQEASMTGAMFGDQPIPCGRPGAKVIFHQHDGRNVYVMCDMCADHALKKRGATELVEIDAEVVIEAEHDQDGGSGL